MATCGHVRDCLALAGEQCLTLGLSQGRGGSHLWEADLRNHGEDPGPQIFFFLLLLAKILLIPLEIGTFVTSLCEKMQILLGGVPQESLTTSVISLSQVDRDVW